MATTTRKPRVSCSRPTSDRTGPVQPHSARPAPKPQDAGSEHSVQLTLTIGSVAYEVEPVQCDPGSARQCIALRKPDGTTYHVSRHDHGAECTCGDFEFNRNHRDPLGCKHIRAAVAMGILDTRAARVQRVPPSAFDEEQEARAAAMDWPEWTDAVRYGIRKR